MRFVIFIIHQGLENIKTFSSIPRPRPRPFFMSSRRLETKTKVSTLHPWFAFAKNSGYATAIRPDVIYFEWRVV